MRIEKPQNLRYELSRRHADRRVSKQVRRSHHAGDSEACLRQLYYRWQGYEPDVQMRESMAMQMGNAAEEGFASEVLHMGLYGSEIEEQHKVVFPIGDHDIVGFIDFLVEMPPDEWAKFFPQYGRAPFPIEVKSLSTNRYEESITNGPFSNHVGQLNLYTCIQTAPFGILMYIQREAVENIPFDLWLVPPDRRRFETVQKRLRTLEQYLRLDAVPSPLCKQDKLDKWCPWSKSRCPHDGGWPPAACSVCGGSLANIADHADCVFGTG